MGFRCPFCGGNLDAFGTHILAGSTTWGAYQCLRCSSICISLRSGHPEGLALMVVERNGAVDMPDKPERVWDEGQGGYYDRDGEWVDWDDDDPEQQNIWPERARKSDEVPNHH